MTYDERVETCQRCSKDMPTEYGNTDNGLELVFTGGYGEFHDDGGYGPHTLWLCHECGHALADWLGLDVHNWHTHRIHGNQHPDHHTLEVS